MYTTYNACNKAASLGPGSLGPGARDAHPDIHLVNASFVYYLLKTPPVVYNPILPDSVISEMILYILFSFSFPA
jgi:hypothetical protein